MSGAKQTWSGRDSSDPSQVQPSCSLVMDGEGGAQQSGEVPPKALWGS